MHTRSGCHQEPFQRFRLYELALAAHIWFRLYELALEAAAHIFARNALLLVPQLVMREKECCSKMQANTNVISGASNVP